ncbi:hypothetical protein ABT404_54130 [Streptomyces hyaluromycini]|uniref:Uncharacterized protein n=1 Tax=Streptomyces hyaluromycini TaxID=1377993 RepID=A0ABV1XGX6_9ACTN
MTVYRRGDDYLAARPRGTAPVPAPPDAPLHPDMLDDKGELTEPGAPDPADGPRAPAVPSTVADRIVEILTGLEPEPSETAGHTRPGNPD